MTVDELRALARDATGPGGLQRPPATATEVLPHLDSDDRNVRVAALRVLSFVDDPAAADGILRALDDPVKRVREVAAKSSPRFLSDERVVARLRLAVERDERGSAGPALAILGGMYGAPYGLSAPEPIAEAMAALARLPRHRQQVLAALLRSRTLTEDTTAVLRDFVATGTKDEAVAATRRLCGMRVERQELLTDDVRRAAERAWGQVWYWVPEDD